MANDSNQFAIFLRLSSSLTGFSEFRLRGTGQAESYFETVSDIVGVELLQDLLETFSSLDSTDAAFEANLRQKLLGSGKLGPVSRNIIKLWYLGTWYQLPPEWRSAYGVSDRDVNFVVSAAAFTEGLLWPTVGVSAPASKPQGYASWGEKPQVITSSQVPSS